ncbi:hypothetical protein [Bartonella sp. B30(2025)]
MNIDPDKVYETNPFYPNFSTEKLAQGVRIYSYSEKLAELSTNVVKILFKSLKSDTEKSDTETNADIKTFFFILWAASRGESDLWSNSIIYCDHRRKKFCQDNDLRESDFSDEIFKKGIKTFLNAQIVAQALSPKNEERYFINPNIFFIS